MNHEFSQANTPMWWETEHGNVHQVLALYIDTLLQANGRRFIDYVRFAALYGNWETAQMTNMFLGKGIPNWRNYKRLSFNVCQSMVDTVTSQRSAEAPDLIAVSNGGTYEQFIQSKLLTNALRAEFSKNNMTNTFSRVVNNALVFGMGYGTAYRDRGRLVTTRVFSPEIVADPYDNVTDTWPHTFSHVCYVNKHTLIQKFPEHAQDIMQAASEPSNYLRVRGDENVRVDESWYCAHDGKMGRHAMSVSTCTLKDEDYEFETPPFAALTWSPPFQGWYGQGLIDQLLGLQVEINDLLEIIHEAQRLFAQPFMLIENGSNVNLAHIQNIPGKLLKYSNIKPEIVKPEMVSQEVYAHLERCYQKAYEIAGISPYAAQAKTLPRLESSKAMNAATDQAEVRHFQFGKACEQWHIDMAKLSARELAILAEEEGYKTRMPHTMYFKNIDWKEINYSIDNFEIQIDTINKQSDSTAGKLQELMDFFNLGAVSVPELRRYLLNPDVKRALGAVTASDEYTDWAIYQMVVLKKPMQPDPFMDVTEASKQVIGEYLRGMTMEMDPAAEENLLNYILQLQALAQKAQQNALMQQAQAQQLLNPPAPKAPVSPTGSAPGK